jgi:hypothetical protein
LRTHEQPFLYLFGNGTPAPGATGAGARKGTLVSPDFESPGGASPLFHLNGACLRPFGQDEVVEDRLGLNLLVAHLVGNMPDDAVGRHHDHKMGAPHVGHAQKWARGPPPPPSHPSDHQTRVEIGPHRQQRGGRPPGSARSSHLGAFSRRKGYSPFLKASPFLNLMLSRYRVTSTTCAVYRSSGSRGPSESIGYLVSHSSER